MKKLLSLLCFTAFGICSLYAGKHHHSTSSSSSGECEPCQKQCVACGDLTRTCGNVTTGCVLIPERTQEYFVGADTCEFAEETVPAAEIFYRAQGVYDPNRPTIVFIHGFAEAGDVWLCAQNELSKCYYTIAMDLRGNGRSTKTPGESDGGIHYTLGLNAEDVHALLQELGITSNIVLVGHSIGGSYAMKYTLLYPDEVTKLVVTGTFPVFQVPDCALAPDCADNCFNPFTCEEGFCDPFGTPTSTVVALATPLVTCLENGGSDEECLGEWGQFIAPLWYSDTACQDELAPAQENLVDAIQAMTPSIIFSIFANGATEDQTADLSNITVPTLITYGTADIIVNPGNADVIHDLIANSALVAFPERSHQMHVTSYKKFDQLVERFINACEFPESSVVFDMGCCICPLTQPIDYADQACPSPTAPLANKKHVHKKR